MSEHIMWNPGKQPDILGGPDSFGNIEWTYPEIIEFIYEPLRKKYPDYITRTSIGFDGSGKYETWAYEFTPEKYQKTIYLQSGVHVIETDGYFGLARLLTLIAERADSRLEWIRDNVRLLVVPCVSVWGISNKGSYEDIMGPGRWNIPHNREGVNSNRDYVNKAAKETVNVIRYFEKYAPDVDFLFDCHSTTEDGWGAYLLPYVNGMPEDLAEKLKGLNRRLYEKNPTSYPIAYMGDNDHYPRPIKDSFIDGFWDEFGVPGATLEHTDYIYDSKLGTSTAMTLSVELYGNHLLQAAEDEAFSGRRKDTKR